MRIEVVPVAGGRELRRFIRVPFAVHRDDPTWIPPLLMERKEAFSAKTNEFLRRAEARFWVARSNGRDVGRISAQIDPLARHNGSPAGHFGCLSAVDDREVFASLLGAAEEFLRSRGIERALGPFSLSINEETGLLVDGFDTPPMMLMGHDPRYAAGHLESLGYRKEKDVYAYLIDRDAAPLSSAVRQLFERRLAKSVRLRQLDFGDYANEIRRMVDIFNDAWSENWGFVPLTNAEADEMAKRMRLLLDARLVWFAEMEGEAVGFIVMLPNVNEAIADLDGRLLPFGWAKLLWRLKMRRVKSARVPLMGVRKRLSGTVIGSTLPIALISALEPGADAFGFRKVELSWILEDNRPMRHILERLGASAYKTYRVYGKALG